MTAPTATSSLRPANEGGIAAVLAAPLQDLLGDPLPIGIRAWDGSRVGPLDAPTVVLRSPRALRRLAWSPGELGLSRAYISGDLDVEGDLGDGLRRIWNLIRERGDVHPGPATMARLAGTVLKLGVLGGPPPAPAGEARLRGRRHSKRRDRAVIAHHYDLSNEFYELILDPQMAYSCAYWTAETDNADLETAQRAKLDLICRKLGVAPGMRLLDVGCGWAGLSIHAARHFGVQVTGVTLSKEQLAFGQARVAALGLDDLVELRLQDYRDVPGDGVYDAVSTVEMGEHVGEANYPMFASTLHRLVRPGGRVLVQQMSRHGVSPGGGAFIERYIAPDMHMRPVGETVDLLESAGLEVRDVQAMRENYTRTIRAWAQTLEHRWDSAVALVGIETARIWRLYMVGSAIAFEEGRMGVDQILAVRPGALHPLPIDPQR
jgi:cyclopropane-fatty-acyl-phospholipid synthase